MTKYVLIIDDDPSVEVILSAALKDFKLIPAYSVRDGREKLDQYNFSAIFFDIELPDGDGLELLTEVTQKNFFNTIPIFVLSSHSEMPNRLQAFSAGVDDFISKPFSPIEIGARLTAKINKYKLLNQGQTQIRHGNVVLDLDRRAALMLKNGDELNLNFTHYEFMIFALLFKNIGKIFSRDDLLIEVWGGTTVASRGIDSHIARIRTKLSESNIKINTVKGEGYSILAE